MKCRCLVCCLLFLLFSPSLAQTVRIQGKEIPYKLMNGRQMVSREALAEAFPGFPQGEVGSVDLAVLVDDPNARVMKRNGLIVSVRYYNTTMAKMYGQSRPKPRSVNGGGAEPGPDQTSSGEYPYRQLMDEIVRLSNLFREENGVASLASDPVLEKSATGHSLEMAKLSYFSHTSPTEGRETPHQRMRSAGCNARMTGENIATFTGHGVETLAEKAVMGWINSPPHRKNLLEPGFTHIGIGVGRNGRTFYLTQNFSGGY